MEGRGGCCISIARYAAAAYGVYDTSKVHRIMLRFRPIAPKPATGGSIFPWESSEVCCKSGRRKRRLSQESNYTKSKRCNKKRRVLNEEKRVTLPLLPETPDCKESVLKPQKGVATMPFLLSIGDADDKRRMVGGGPTEQTMVTVESLTDTDTWVSGDVLGSTDEEKKVNLGRDTCPGFISDAMGRVMWTNGAYKEMIGGETMVGLAMKEGLPLMIRYPAFACRVRVQYAGGSSLTLPCDVWVMEGGGFAWRLDTNAALCLGR